MTWSAAMCFRTPRVQLSLLLIGGWGRLPRRADDLKRSHVLQVLRNEGLVQVGDVLPACRLGHLGAHLRRVKPAQRAHFRDAEYPSYR